VDDDDGDDGTLLIIDLREIKGDVCDEPMMKDTDEWASKPNTMHLKPFLAMIYYFRRCCVCRGTRW